MSSELELYRERIRPVQPAELREPEYFGRSSETAADLHIVDGMRTIWTRRWVVVGTVALSMAAAALYLVVATPIYRARTAILIEPETSKLEAFKPPSAEERSQIDYYQTQFQILRSRSLASDTLGALDLWSHPEFRAPSSAHSEEERRAHAIDWFEKRLGVLSHQDSRMVEVTFESADPKLATRILNTLADAYVTQNQKAHLVVAKDSSHWLMQQVEEQRKAMDASEVALQRYREANGFLSTDGRSDVVTQNLAEVSSALTHARTERLQKEALYQRIQQTQNVDDLGSFPAVQSSMVIQQLRTEIADLDRQQAQLSQQIGDRHPDLVRIRTALQMAQARLRDEIQRIADMSREDYLNARNQEDRLAAALSAQKAAALEHNRVGIEFETLKRRADTDRQIFEALLQRAKEMQISGELPINNIRIVDRAEPPAAAVRPNKPLTLALTFLAALPLGVAAAFGRDYLDRRIRSGREIRTKLGLTFLGVVPAADGATARPLITESDRTLFADGIRALRANVLWRAADTRAVLVTSAAAGEGKTVVAANLAVALAQAGRRVLLVDADMRRPKIDEMFHLPPSPGLAGVAEGAAAVWMPSEVRHLSILAAGNLGERSASEFLGSPQFSSLLLRLGERFDHIIIDSPPVLTAVDAGLIAGLGPAVLFVVGADTDRQAAMEALERLATGRATFLGAVMNRVAVGRRGYLSPYYYSNSRVA